MMAIVCGENQNGKVEDGNDHGKQPQKMAFSWSDCGYTNGDNDHGKRPQKYCDNDNNSDGNDGKTRIRRLIMVPVEQI